jgi:hypothetical protein
MTATPPTVGSKTAARDLLRVWGVGLLAAAGLGLGAALTRPENLWLVFGVFTACCLGPCVGLAWLTVGAGRRVEIDARAEENVETRWIEKAASGALFDLLLAAGLLAGAMSLLSFELPGDGVLLGIWALALTDGMLRYALIRRRES